jgi:hypothetical protein
MSARYFFLLIAAALLAIAACVAGDIITGVNALVFVYGAGSAIILAVIFTLYPFRAAVR